MAAEKSNTSLNNPVLAELESLTQEEFNSKKDIKDRLTRISLVNEITEKVSENTGDFYKGIMKYYALKEDYYLTFSSDDIKKQKPITKPEDELCRLSKKLNAVIDNESDSDTRCYMKALLILRTNVNNLSPLELTFKNTDKSQKLRQETAKTNIEELFHKQIIRAMPLLAEIQQELSPDDPKCLDLLKPAIKVNDHIATATAIRLLLSHYSNQILPSKYKKNITLAQGATEENVMPLPNGLTEEDIKNAAKDNLESGNEQIIATVGKYLGDVIQALPALYQSKDKNVTENFTETAKNNLKKMAEVGKSVALNKKVEKYINEILEVTGENDEEKLKKAKKIKDKATQYIDKHYAHNLKSHNKVLSIMEKGITLLEKEVNRIKNKDKSLSSNLKKRINLITITIEKQKKLLNDQKFVLTENKKHTIDFKDDNKIKKINKKYVENINTLAQAHKKISGENFFDNTLSSLLKASIHLIHTLFGKSKFTQSIFSSLQKRGDHNIQREAVFIKNQYGQFFNKPTKKPPVIEAEMNTTPQDSPKPKSK